MPALEAAGEHPALEGQRWRGKTHTNEDPFALDVNVGDGKLVGERHDVVISLACKFSCASDWQDRNLGDE